VDGDKWSVAYVPSGMTRHSQAKSGLYSLVSLQTRNVTSNNISLYFATRTLRISAYCNHWRIQAKAKRALTKSVGRLWLHEAYFSLNRFMKILIFWPLFCMKMDKKLSASRGLRPVEPYRGSAPEPRWRLRSALAMANPGSAPDCNHHRSTFCRATAVAHKQIRNFTVHRVVQ